MKIDVRTAQDGPRFTHDSDCCTFLGIEGRYDMYYCDQGILPTVILRFSDEGADYSSGMVFAEDEFYNANKGHPLAEAFRKARDLAIARELYAPVVRDEIKIIQEPQEPELEPCGWAEMHRALPARRPGGEMILFADNQPFSRPWTLREHLRMNRRRRKNRRKAKRYRRHWARVNDRGVRV
jgi:hypothetical protein